MAIELSGRDIYLRHTACDGKSNVQQHRVWDAERFISSQEQEAQKMNEDQKEGEPRMAAVQQITEDQYRKERAK
jgi:valyl-tRNA synthetase